MASLALYQPEIAANLGAAIRTAACFGAPLHVIEPCGFPWRDRGIRRVALDYETELLRHTSYEAFRNGIGGRLILLSTKAETPYDRVSFEPGDILLLGQESAGVPEAVHDDVDLRVSIPLVPGARSLNVVVAGAVALAEAARQLRARERS
jgi:tRNA (cytidine/uridine-2'-O-)-methyltransferase